MIRQKLSSGSRTKFRSSHWYASNGATSFGSPGGRVGVEEPVGQGTFGGFGGSVFTEDSARKSEGLG